jgi:hypothetical protein
MGYGNSSYGSSIYGTSSTDSSSSSIELISLEMGLTISEVLFIFSVMPSVQNDEKLWIETTRRIYPRETE